MKKIIWIILILFLCSACTMQPKTQLPEPTSEPIETPAPTPIINTTIPLQESTAVDDSYFDDVVFVGDSRTLGLLDFNLLSNSTVLASLSLSVNDLDIKKVIPHGTENITVMEALKEKPYRVIYINFGFNELGWSYPELFIEKYGKIIDEIKAIQPQATIIISPLFHVSKRHEQKNVKYENNANIDLYNEMILNMATEKNLLVLNVHEVVEDEEGYLISDYTEDGTHLDIHGYQIWVEYIKTHTMEGNQQ